MASAKTKAIQAPLTSRHARLTEIRPNAPEKADALRLSPGERKVVSAWTSSDGRAVYAYDGVSVRRMN